MAAKRSTPVIAATVIERTREGIREVLIARLAEGHHAGRWAFPYTPAEPSETPEAAARRLLGQMEGLDAQLSYGQPPFDAELDGKVYSWRFVFCSSSAAGEVGLPGGSETRWIPVGSLRDYEFDPVSAKVADWLVHDAGT